MSVLGEDRKFKVGLAGRDRIEVNMDGESPKVSFRGCTELMGLMQMMRKNFGINLSQWPIPKGVSHSEILLRELILRLRGEWRYPQGEAEVCHCRNIACLTIDQAIIAGAHSTEIVSRQTSASTACGTCRPQVQKMIDYRLNGGLPVLAENTVDKKSA
jgi:bacterioferritin-associated ferredoxin